MKNFDDKKTAQSGASGGGFIERTLKRTSGFFSRLLYVVSLVWAASPAVFIAMCFFCVFSGILPVIGSYISKYLLDGIAELLGSTTSSDIVTDLFVTMRPIIFLFALELVYVFLKRISARLNNMVTALAGELVINHIRLMIIGKAKTVDQKSFDDIKFYEKLENANREAGMRPIGILTATFNVISAVISVASFIVVLATLTPIAPIIIIAASVPGALVNYYFRNRNFRYLRRHSKERRRMNYYSEIMTNKDSAKEIKLLSLGDTFTDKYKQSFDGYYKGLKKIITKEGLYQVLVSLLYVLASSALFVYVAYEVVFGGGKIGDYSLYAGALNSIASYVTIVVTSTATIYEGTLFIENMIDFMNEESTVVPSISEPKLPKRACAHTIELKDVSFRYPGTERDVISHVNLTLKSDSSVILVGLNGAGKSTLIKLLTRLYDPTEGVILLDGVDIREYDTSALYDMYGIIFQDFGRYADTVSENIRFGDAKRPYSTEEVELAAERGRANGFIERLPQGYDTHLTRLFEESGIEPSGGEWQKLSIARAFYKKSDILIMDEPTASLDPIAEKEVFTMFSELSRGKISVFVSHRLSGATTAGQIVVLENGRIAECGTHEELMEKRGQYYILFSTQAERYK